MKKRAKNEAPTHRGKNEELRGKRRRRSDKREMREL